jgi:acyl carrier protein
MNQRLATVLADVLNLKESDIHSDLDKADVGDWDSLKQMDLVVSLEREYRITLEIPDILRMNSVSEIIAVLTEKGVSLGN